MITRDIVDRDLHQLQEDLTRMRGLVDTAIRRVIEALRDPCIDQAEAVIASIKCLTDDGVANHKRKSETGPRCQ
jgi:hypothetical protein